MVVVVVALVLLARVMVVVVVGAEVAVLGTPVLGVGTAETVSLILLPKPRLKRLTLRARRILASILMPMKTSLLRPAAMMCLHQSTHLQRLIWVTH
jgi:hypothetical protein